MLAVKKGCTLILSIKYPHDLTGYTIASELRDDGGQGALVTDLDPVMVVDPAAQHKTQITLTLPAAITENLEISKSKYAFDVKASLGPVSIPVTGNEVHTIAITKRATA